MERLDVISERLAPLAEELIAFRRDLHSHPELGREEHRTTGLLVERLRQAGLDPRVLPGGTGLLCDIGAGGDDGGGEPFLALRADLDALPMPDTKDVEYRSTVPDRCHACGHDVHTTVLLGAALVLAGLPELLHRPVRCVFQPAEEVIPGGAHDVIDAGGLEDVGEILALHCDPHVEVGRIGLRTGPLTAACDKLTVALDGSGGHTARPHLTADLVTALAKIATEVPAALTRRVDPRSGLSLVWGRVAGGSAANVIPEHVELEGTLRCLEVEAWRGAPELIHELVELVATAYGAKWQIDYQRGVPPVDNKPESVARLRAAMTRQFGPQAVTEAEQSLGGEDFSWYLEQVPGAMARLGVRPPGDAPARDIHQGGFDVDEHSIGTGVELLVAAALTP